MTLEKKKSSFHVFMYPGSSANVSAKKYRVVNTTGAWLMYQKNSAGVAETALASAQGGLDHLRHAVFEARKTLRK